MKARNVSKGDWIKIGGKAVKVEHVEDTSFWGALSYISDGKAIHYKGGSKSGVLRRGADAQVSHLVSRCWWSS